MKQMGYLLMMCVVFTMLLWRPASAWNLLDDKLEVRGSIQQTSNIPTHQDERDLRIYSLRTIGRGEVMYKIKDCPDDSITFYGLANYYYDFALDADSHLKNSIRNEAGRSKLKYFRHPRDEAQFLKEFYIDFKQPEFQVRVGKQLVSWGETAEARVADLINPLDTNYLIAFPDWEDYKLGLWMLRGFYTPRDMWQELSFEGIFIPYFEPQILPPYGCGAFAGAAVSTQQQPLLDKMRHDAPGWSADDFEAGLRLRGYLRLWEGFDYYLSYFYTRADSAIIKGQKEYFEIVKSMLLGTKMKGKIFTYPHYNSFAFSFTTTAHPIKADIRSETVYNTRKNYQYGTYDMREKDMVCTSLRLGWSLMVPYLSAWNRETAYTVSLTGYQYWLLNWEDELKGAETGWRDNLTKINLAVSTSFLFGTLLPAFNTVWDGNNGWTHAGALTYAPVDHWQYTVSYQKGNKAKNTQFSVNQVVLSVRYEFW